jgi:tetratricopeptide (TPR) repeat protein
MGNYHPLSMISLAIDYQIDKFNPFIFHFTNLLFHTANAVLVFLVFYNLTRKMDLAVVAGLLFGVHTLHVESVAWVSERKDVLYAFFYLISLLNYTRYLEKKEKKWFLWSLVFFIFSLFSKGQAVTLVLSIILIDFYKGRKIFDQKVLLEKVPFLLLALLFGFIAIKSQQGVKATEMVSFTPEQRLPFAAYGFVMYIVKLVYPFNLSAYYPYPVNSGSSDIPFVYWVCILPVLVYMFFLLVSFRKSKAVFFAMAFFLVNIFLLLQLLPVGGAIMADRYAYIPSIGFCFLAGYVVSQRNYLRQARIAYFLAAGYIVLLGVLTFERTKVWKNTFTLWTDVIEKNENVPLAWYNRGNARSDTANYKGAIEDYNMAIRIFPLYYNAFINRANAKTKVNDFVGAIEDLNFVISHDSTYANAYINRAMARRNLKDLKGALDDYQVALRIQPMEPKLYLARGSMLFEMKENESAIRDFTKAIEIDPVMAEAYINRASVKKAMGDQEGAVADYDKAIEIQPGNGELYNNRGNIRFQQGRNQEAIADYGRSIKADPKNYLAYKNRGAVYFSLKDFHSALQDYSDAIRINPKEADLYYTRALIKKELDDMSGAVSDYKIAAELNPDFGTETFSKNLGVQAIQSVPLYEKYNREALVLDQQGKFPEAIALFKKAIDLKADYAEAWFNIGNTYGKTGRYSDAVAAFNKAIASKHDYAEAYAGRGIAHASLGMIQEALKDMGSAISIKSDFAMVYFNRAILYLNTGKKNLACSDLAKAVQLGYSDAYAIYEKECEGK